MALGVFISVVYCCVVIIGFMLLARLLTIEVSFAIWLCTSFLSFSCCFVRAWYSDWFEYPMAQDMYSCSSLLTLSLVLLRVYWRDGVKSYQ